MMSVFIAVLIKDSKFLANQNAWNSIIAVNYGQFHQFEFFVADCLLKLRKL